MKTDIQHGDTTTLPEFRWETWPGKLEGPKGLGKIYKAIMGSVGNEIWIYETPKGWQVPIGSGKKPMPALTRSDKPEQRCGCGKFHTCSQCGNDSWIEYHGNSDGRCGFCWYSG